ncbi:hypothetical protein BUALT_Bualt02G0067200 [Buddleja alternifolia]|uniref:Uncharacterized protein n=1 Tax=Buddleja alternifolia TaxID=168488 RepID=A0AAV6Y602_9LAMI|nr:hypothetical protein BUALT_Bualt02G0067200 [Buddleja alternifolia]
MPLLLLTLQIKHKTFYDIGFLFILYIYMEIANIDYCHELVAVEEEGCSTPKRGIPMRSTPPPPPRKKPLRHCAGKREPPRTGYFQPPDLDQIFVVRSRPEAEACA